MRLQGFFALEGIIKKVDEIDLEIEKRSERAKAAQSALKAYKTTQRLKSASELIGKTVAIEEQKVSLSQKSKIITEAQNKYDYFNKAEKIMNAHKRVLQESMAAMKTCPTCLQPITQSVMKKIVGEI